jgi:epsilon-lactone hydrolase
MSRIFLALTTWWCFMKTKDKDVKFMRFLFKVLLSAFRVRNGIVDALGDGEDEERVPESQEYRAYRDVVLALSRENEIVSPKKWAFAMRTSVWNDFFESHIQTRRLVLGGVETFEFKYPGAVKNDSKTILYLHGGAYTAGHPMSYKTFSGTLSRGCSMRVISVNYTLGYVPSAVRDSLAVYRDLVKVRGISPYEISIAGDSAGGGLTLLLLAAIRDEGLPMCACAVPISPWCDLTNSGASMKEGRDILLRNTKQFDEFSLLAVGRDSTLLSDPKCSPLFQSFQNLCPLYIVCGESEALRDDSIRAAKRARSQGVRVHLDIVEFMPHIFPVFGSFLPEGAAATSRICDFITKHCQGVEPSIRSSNDGETNRLRSRM